MTAEVEPSVFVGIDWGSETHQVYAMSASGEALGERAFAHGGEGLHALGVWLASLGAAGSVVVAIETPRGPIVEALLERQLAVYAINPKQMDRFRDRHCVAGAKDDRFDARVLADSLRTDRACFRALRADAALIVELREWSRMVEELGEEQRSLSNRIRAQLWRYYPQMLEVAPDLTAGWFLELWQLAPTPAHLKHLKRAKVEALLARRHVRRITADELLITLKKKALVVSIGTTRAAEAHVRLLIDRLELVSDQLKKGLGELDRICNAMAEGEPGQEGEQRDVVILRSLPGVGRIVLAALLAEAAEPLHEANYHALRALSGIAPVTRRSGKSNLVVMRYACNGRLRNALYHWANCAIQRDPRAHEKYRELRKRGHSHARALRGLGDRLLKIACAMLRDGAVFDPEHRHRARAA